MFGDIFSLLISIAIIMIALIALSILSGFAIPILIVGLLILCIYYPYAKMCKKFFRNTRLYSGCWRRLYRYCHLRDKFNNYIANETERTIFETK